MSDTANICQMEDPSERLGFLRSRQTELHMETVECAQAIDATMAELVADGTSGAEVGRLAGLSRQEVSRRIARAARPA